MTKGLTTGIIYIPLDVRWPRSKKARALIVRHGLEGMAAWALYLAMACYCRENLTDGYVPAEELGALGYPLALEQVDALVKLLLDHRLLEHSPGHGLGHSPGHSPGHGLGHSPGHSPGDGGGYLVRAYVKRNGTRVEALRMAARLAEWGRAGAGKRWSEDDDGLGHSPGHGPGHSRPHAQTETESETETRPPARAGAGARAREEPHQDDDESDLAHAVVAMLSRHGPITHHQALGWIGAVLASGGSRVTDTRRYVMGAARTDGGRRAYREATAPTEASSSSRQPAAVSQLCRRCSRTDHRTEDCPTAQQATSTSDRELVRAEGGGPAARKLLANRERPAQQEPAAPELHGEALARQQAALSRAERGSAPRPPEPEDPEPDHHEHEEPREPEPHRDAEEEAAEEYEVPF